MNSVAAFGMVMAAFLLGGAAPQPNGGGVTGDWRNTRDTIHIRVAPCGDRICGKVIWANDVARRDARKGSGQELLGSQLLTDLRRQQDGTWRGRVYVPDLNMRASARVTQVERNKLRVTGCAVAGLVCQTRHWHRID